MKSRLARWSGFLLAASLALVLLDPGANASAPVSALVSASSVPTAPKAAGTGTSGARAATISTAPGQPVGVPGTWKLRFQDNFSGTQLNHDKWRANWMGATNATVTKNFNWREKSCYDPAQVTVADGSLRLKAEKRKCRASTGKVYDYASGLVQSSQDYKFTYGYAEARMYLPRNDDPALGAVGSCAPNWPAFWLDGSHWPVSGEIDVMECLGRDDVAWHYHWANGEAGASPSAWKGKLPGTSSWHTFGVDWRPGSLTFYYDGVVVGRQTTGVTSEPHHLVANLSISGTKIKAPQTVKVDYIRVWKRAS